MSMLSAQCDELRSMAESVGLAMPQAATLMMEAADTIWELRCKCAGMVDMRERARLAEAENAKLRELVRNLRRVIPADVVGVVVGANTDHPTYYKFDEAFRELGVEVDG